MTSTGLLALTGGTGFVGQTLIEMARDRGMPVRALTRREQDPLPGVEWVRGDLEDRDALRRLVRGAEAVIHAAGVVSGPDPEIFETANVGGTLSLVEAAVAEGVPRFVFVSSLAARMPRLSAYGASKAKAEKIVSASGLDWTIVRPPAVYGPRDREMFELFRAARWGVVPMPPPGRLSVIHVGDLCRALLALLPGDEDVTHCLFEVDDGRLEGWADQDLARAIGMAMNRRVSVPHLSRGTLGLVSRIDCLLRGDKAKLTRDRVSYMTHHDWVARVSKRPPATRWKPQIETREGLRETAQWYREQGWL